MGRELIEATTLLKAGAPGNLEKAIRLLQKTVYSLGTFRGIDRLPQGLKLAFLLERGGMAEARPLQKQFPKKRPMSTN